MVCTQFKKKGVWEMYYKRPSLFVAIYLLSIAITLNCQLSSSGEEVAGNADDISKKEKFLAEMHRSWLAQRDSVFSCDLHINRVVGGLSLAQLGLSAGGFAMSPIEFEEFVNSLDFSPGKDGLSLFAKAFRNDLTEKKRAFTSYRFVLYNGRTRIERAFEQDTQTMVSDSENEVIGLLGSKSRQVDIFPRGSSPIHQLELEDIRYVPQLQFPALRTSVEFQNDLAEIAFGGRYPTDMLVDTESFFVFRSKRGAERRQVLILQQGPVEYADGAIWPNVFVKAEFREGQIQRYEANVVVKAEINTKISSENFKYERKSPRQAIIDHRDDQKEFIRPAEHFPDGLRDVIKIADSHKQHNSLNIEMSPKNNLAIWINLIVIGVIVLILICRRIIRA